MQSNYTILVNTTDSFEDCWFPFFKLFKKYWPEYKGKIYLNTETKDYYYEGLNIIPIKNQLSGATWSKCLKYALNKIEEDVIFYLQEDYFLNDFVNDKTVEFYCKEMEVKPIDCVHLTPFASNGPFEKAEHPNLLRYSKKAAYKIGLQASLWHKKAMLKYLKDHENAWHFEVFGTKRAWRHNEEFYIVDFKKINKEIIPYTPTGIVKGKWNKDAVIGLFAKHEIEVDFSIRGFYQQKANNKKNKITPQKIINRIRSLI